jgi:hypothetical protein
MNFIFSPFFPYNSGIGVKLILVALAYIVGLEESADVVIKKFLVNGFFIVIVVCQSYVCDFLQIDDLDVCQIELDQLLIQTFSLR